MIPKIIHYVWFGGQPFPPKVQKCINSWRETMPDYEIKEWNESNFDVNEISFTQEAAGYKKWAFVSDYVRLKALYEYGGWYMDVDVETIRSLTPLANDSVVISTEEGGFIEGAVMGSVPNHSFWKQVMDHYKGMHFVLPDGGLNQEVNNTYLQLLLKEKGYVMENKHQLLADGIRVYPDDYLHVCSLTSGKLHLTENSYAIHWHTLLWVDNKTKFIRFMRMHVLVPLLGEHLYSKLVNRLRK